jgi:hypothetical protein
MPARRRSCLSKLPNVVECRDVGGKRFSSSAEQSGNVHCSGAALTRQVGEFLSKNRWTPSAAATILHA